VEWTSSGGPARSGRWDKEVEGSRAPEWMGGVEVGTRGAAGAAGPLRCPGAVLWQLEQRRVYNVTAAHAAVCCITLQAGELIVSATASEVSP
jgi:hypothetical protein